MLLRALALVAALLAAPAAQAEFYHRIDTHFGVVATRDAATGTTTTQPIAGTALTLGWQTQMDNGMRFRFELELDLRNSPRPDVPFRGPYMPGARGAATFQFP
jgi:predicted porin